MNLFFFIYQPQEFYNFFPVALELKKKRNNANIYFIFTNYAFYKKILEDKYIREGLKKYFKIIVLKQIRFFKRKFHSLFLRIFLLKKILEKKTIFFFPEISYLKHYKFITNFCKSRGGKNMLLSKGRYIHSSIIIFSIKTFTEKVLNFNQQDINLFDYFIFYHKDNIIFKKICLLSNSNHSKIINLGLPNLYSSWKKFLKKSGESLKRELKKEYIDYTSIYTIIGGKDFNKLTINLLKNKDSQRDSLIKILNAIKEIEPKSLIFFKTHPRDNIMPNYLKESLKETNIKRVIVTSINIEILASISKRCIFTSTSAAISDLYNTNKIDVAEYKQFKDKKIRTKRRYLGLRTIYIDPNDKSFFAKIKKSIINNKEFEKPYNNYKEKKIMKENQPNFKNLLENI